MTGQEDTPTDNTGIQLPVLPSVKTTDELPSEAPITPKAELVTEETELSPPVTRKSRRQIIQARRRQMAFLEKRREQKRRKVFYRKLKRLAGLIYLFMIGAAVFFIVTSSIWRFDGNSFTLHNANLLTEKNIRPLIAAYQDWPMIRIDPEDISAAVKAQYNIAQEVYVRRALFPPRLDITVVEKQPFAELYSASNAHAPYGLMTHDLSVIPLALYPYNPKHPPYKQSLARVILPANSTLNPSAMMLLSKVTAQLLQVPTLHFKQLTFVSTPAPKGSRQKVNISLEAQFQEIRVLLGTLDWELPKRLARLTPLVPKIMELQGMISDVDLRWTTQVTFRKKSEYALSDIIGKREESLGH